MGLDRESAIAALVKHHLSRGYRPEDCYPYVVNTDGKYLGPYIPYIGESYYKIRPRLLMYAMAQNLSRAKQLVRVWLDSPHKGLLRQYDDPDTLSVHVYPYDNGHLKVIAALTLNSFPGTYYKPTRNIDDLVAVTNFVKFSFYREDEDGKPLDANPPLDIYDDMWEYYCRYEVSILRPDVILGVGSDVSSAIVRNLEKEHEPNIVVLKIPFPGRLNLNSRWVPKGRQLIKAKNHDPTVDVSEMQSLLRGTPDTKGKLSRAIETDWYYFREMKAYLTKELSRCA